MRRISLGDGKAGPGSKSFTSAAIWESNCDGIKAGDPGDAALAGEQVVPEGIDLVTQWGHHAQAGDDYPALCPVAGHKIKRGSLS